MLNPCLLNRMKPICSDPFDRGYLSIRHGTHRCDAGPDSLAVFVHGTSPAQRYAASKLCSREPENVAEIPQQSRFRVTAE